MRIANCIIQNEVQNYMKLSGRNLRIIDLNLS